MKLFSPVLISLHLGSRPGLAPPRSARHQGKVAAQQQQQAGQAAYDQAFAGRVVSRGQATK